MTDKFHTAIRKSLADHNLRAALTANAERRIRVRKNAFAAFQDPQAMRRAAHAVRADVVDHLDQYLDQFITQAQANGVVVHQAANAAQAIQLVLEIAQRNGARLVAKSKTMVSEEIGLNHAIEKHNLEVVETDLGEYIVQLRGEPPSHIITPAVHLRRQDVGKLFHEKLGMPYSDDISLMTNVARKTLRQVFLNADVGISGVNFGVAETGALCLVTNEGNGRMVTTVPRVHIALMGMERLVPTMRDLALMLSLLPRSATGQKLTAYTSLINSPRRPGDPDGPQERHVILVDNGRKSTRESELKEILYCIRCGACLNACPVFREIGGHAYVSCDGKSSPYPGPMGSVVSPALFGQAEYGHLARASSLCGACREACPVDIDLPKLLLRVRTGKQTGTADRTSKPNAPVILAGGLGIFSFAAASPWRFALAQRLVGLFGSVAAFFTKGDPWLSLPKISGWGYSKDFPRPARQPFRSRFKAHNQELTTASEGTKNKVETPEATEMPIPMAPMPVENPLDRFSTELEALGGHVVSCLENMLQDEVSRILSNKDITQLLAWDADYLPSNLVEGLSEKGIAFIYPNAETIEVSSHAQAGLTGAYAGLADTGSLVLLGGKGMPLLASLLPEIHIAVLREKDIYATLADVLQHEQVRNAPSEVVITGPSRTSDIEMTLTIGVHGPGELYVICVKD
jgi:L-lactate dehydrogenase complex protein LldF